MTAANVVDHVTPHRGGWTAFVTGELQSLREPCHKLAKLQIELHGYRTDIGLDGACRPIPIIRSIGRTRALVNRPAASAFVRTGHRANIAEMTETLPNRSRVRTRRWSGNEALP